ncbi:GNAT family N-acetyltransferase [Psychrobium sp. 1_MG-2023]|uniref:GNAT family N-acetyltransferase n=1 Tax=Psychrobium sp. 1_MG-2023 TaxID=3062624 RepID=UPI000C3440E5|nr:GNAT family N-acetyltransferase [Psychrobium sp. 1_MG-2023]MDP2560850.1 GNAT family N-acetyltransferase [Psychrobium sp. 1_MG-2023]PKF56724.1 hypothetical protein CW748_09605 [Alteromonadales bacterium alter-6D02]
MQKVQLLAGEQALSKLNCKVFQQQWFELYQACRWATPFQSVEFILCWFEHYNHAYLPLVVLEENEQGVQNLWLLAQDQSTSMIVHAGAHQAEYQCWLSCNDRFDSFLKRGLVLLKGQTYFPELTLKFLPPILSHIIATTDQLTARHIMRNEQQPLIRFDAKQAPWASLRKKSNKSKLSRLRKLGDVSIELVSEGASGFDDDLQRIATCYDLRQGAVNHCLPFRQDSHKLAFTHALISHHQDVKILKMTLNNTIIAAVVGVINQGEFSVAVFSYDPTYSRHSPGKLLMLMGAQLLAERQLKAIDLTPGGTWKARYANAYANVSVLRLFIEPIAYYRACLSELLLTSCKRLLRHCDMTPQQARDKAQCLRQRLGLQTQPVSIVEAYDNYQINICSLLAVEVSFVIRENQLVDFVEFSCQLSMEQQSHFLSHCLARLEAGATGYSVKELGVVKSCGWVVPPSKHREAAEDHPANSENFCLLADIYCAESLAENERQSYLIGIVQREVIRREKSGQLTLLVSDEYLKSKQFHHSAFSYVDSASTELSQLLSHN